MITPILTFFSNKGGVGKTSLTYHLAWMYANLGKRVVVVDADPQANLTANFLDNNQIEALWEERSPGSTIYRCLASLRHTGKITEPNLQHIATNLYLLPSDVDLFSFEETLATEWQNNTDNAHLYRHMLMLSSLWQVMQKAAEKVQAEIILVDIGPNLSALNRSALVAADFVVTPLGLDLFSLQSLQNIGPTLRNWRGLWHEKLKSWRSSVECSMHADFKLPEGNMEPVGYICQQYSMGFDRSVQDYDKWAQQIPGVYRKSVLGKELFEPMKVEDDPYYLATIRHYRSLIPMAQEHRKPIFNLSSADGAIGSHAAAVQDAKRDYKNLAQAISTRITLAETSLL